MQPLSPTFGRIYDGLYQSRMLEKKASVASDEEATEALQQKATNDFQTFELAKTAGLEQLGQFARTYAPQFGKGLAVAGGAAIPAVVGGNMVADHAADQFRNRALEAGMGLAGTGAALYGLHRLTSNNKTAAEEDKDLNDALEKLASIGYLDNLLGAACADKEASEEARKLAQEVRMLNREFGIEVLRNLVG